MTTTASTTGLGTADIVGIAIGGFLGLVTVIGIIISLYSMCCKKNKPGQVWAEPQQHYPLNNGYGQQTNTGYYPPNNGYGQQTNTGYYPQQPNQYPQQPYGNKQSANYDQPPPYQLVNPRVNTNGKY